MLNRNILSLPAQAISKKFKTEKWIKENLDMLDQIARRQFLEKMSLVENYQMVKGKFIYHHYFEYDGYKDVLSTLAEDFDMPSYLRHYDIISPMLHQLIMEYMNREETLRAYAYDEHSTNEYRRIKTRLLQKYVAKKINDEINALLKEEGLEENPDPQAFSSQEEADSHNNKVAQAKQAMTPKELEEYMRTEWQDAAEIWANAQLKADAQFFNWKFMERNEIEDMFIAAECYREHCIDTADNSRIQNTWNPIYVFDHSSPEVVNCEEGDYVGRTFFMTRSDAIDTFAKRLNKAQLNILIGEDNKADKEIFKDGYGVEFVRTDNTSPLAYGTIPHEGFQMANLFRETIGFNPATDAYPSLNAVKEDGIQGNNYGVDILGYIRGIHVYWRSQKKIGKLCFRDPEIGAVVKVLVDESIVLPPYIKESKFAFNDEQKPDTIVWTYQSVIREGIKLSEGPSLSEDIYISGNELEYQFFNRQGKLLLPVCGGKIHQRNATPTSVVDMVKSYQIFFNVFMNQTYQIVEREVGKVMILDSRIIPNKKDWGTGDESLERFRDTMKAFNMAVTDSGAGGERIASQGYIKEYNGDESARMNNRIQLAETMRQLAYMQVGLNPQRMAQVQASESAEGIKTAMAQSFAQTEIWFNYFNDYKQRVQTMSIQQALFVETKKDKIEISHMHDDMSREYIKMAAEDLENKKLDVVIVNSAVDRKNLEIIKQMAVTNNTAGASLSELFEAISSTNSAQLRKKLQTFEANRQKIEENAQKMQQEQLQKEMEMQIQELDKTLAQEKDLTEKRIASAEKIAYINSFRYQEDNVKDMDSSGIPDSLEYDRLASEAWRSNQETALKKMELENKMDIEKSKILVAEKKIQADQRKAELQLKIAQENKNKFDSKTPKKTTK